LDGFAEPLELFPLDLLALLVPAQLGQRPPGRGEGGLEPDGFPKFDAGVVPSAELDIGAREGEVGRPGLGIRLHGFPEVLERGFPRWVSARAPPGMPSRAAPLSPWPRAACPRPGPPPATSGWRVSRSDIRVTTSS